MTIPGCGFRGHLQGHYWFFLFQNIQDFITAGVMAQKSECPCTSSSFIPLCFCSDEFSASKVALVLVAATIGVVTVLSLLYRVTRVVLSLFVIPGKSVCL